MAGTLALGAQSSRVIDGRKLRQGQSPVRVLVEKHPARSGSWSPGWAVPPRGSRTDPQPAAKRSLLRTSSVGGSAPIGGGGETRLCLQFPGVTPASDAGNPAVLRLGVRSVQPREGGLVPRTAAHTCGGARTPLTHSVTLAQSSGMLSHKAGVPRESPREGRRGGRCLQGQQDPSISRGTSAEAQARVAPRGSLPAVRLNRHRGCIVGWES